MPRADTRYKWPFVGSLDSGELLAYRLYVDARIEPGRSYRIRPTNKRDYLFNGKALTLLRLHPAEYCFRMTFDVSPEDRTDLRDEKSRCVYTDNWSPAGIALNPELQRAHRSVRDAGPTEKEHLMISANLREYLESEGKPYELLHHRRTFTSMETAAAAHVPGDQIAKAVVVEDESGYLLAVVPSTHRLRFSALRERFGHAFGLATEAEIRPLFKDCETGSIPPFGQAYGLKVVVDERLLNEDDVYCESGEHTELLHLYGEDFRDLMAEAEYGDFSRHV